MNIIYSIISVLGSSASLVFTIWFLIVFGKGQYKKSIKFLIFTIISIVLAIYFNTNDVVEYNRGVYNWGGVLIIIIGVYMLANQYIYKIVALATIAIGFLSMICLSNFFAPNSVSSSPSYNSYEKDDKNGFIGSDGKYHEYIPEFGDDVNNWMEENW